MKGRKEGGRERVKRKQEKKERRRERGRKMAEVEADANTYSKQKCRAFSFRTFHIEHPREYKRINQSNFQLNTRQPSSRKKN